MKSFLIALFLGKLDHRLLFSDIYIYISLAHLEPEAYAEPWHFQNRGIFRTLGYSEPKAYSEPCQTSEMEHCAKIVNSYSCFHKL